MRSFIRFTKLRLCGSSPCISVAGDHLAISVFFFGALALPASCAGADVFASTDANGHLRWSSQALDNSYRKVPALSTAGQETIRVTTTGVSSKTTTAAVAAMEARKRSLYPLIETTAQRYGVNTEMVTALIEVESGFNTNAISPKGARGLMQLMPATAKRYGMNQVSELHDPARNIDMGVRHLKDLLRQNDGQWALVMAAYNAGQHAVTKHGQRIPNYNETMLYVPAVLAKAAHFTKNIPASSTMVASSK